MVGRLESQIENDGIVHDSHERSVLLRIAQSGMGNQISLGVTIAGRRSPGQLLRGCVSQFLGRHSCYFQHSAADIRPLDGLRMSFKMPVSKPHSHVSPKKF